MLEVRAQKPWAPGDDLSAHDVIEDDCDLVVGPLASKLSSGSLASSASGRHLCSTSFKDTSILGTAAVASKLAQSVSVPAPALARRASIKVSSDNVYCGGNPIIATATASVSRPVSAAFRQPRMSAPSGGSGPAPDAATGSRSAHGGVGSDDAADGLVSRMEGDIQGGDSDEEAPAKLGPALLRRRDSGRKAAAATVMSPVGAKSGSSSTPADALKSVSEKALNGVPGGASTGGGSTPSTSTCQHPWRASCEIGAGGRGGVLPWVDVDPERRRVLRENGVLEGPAPLAIALAVQPKGSSAPLSPRAAVPSAGGGAARSALPASCESRPAGKQPPCPGEAAEKPAGMVQRLSSGRFLSRLLTGSLVTPDALEPHDPSDTAAKECAGRAPSFRNLFSRPPSALRKSEVGTAPQPVRKQQRHSHHGQSSGGVATCDGGQEDTGATSIGEGRQPSGLLKRTASAIALAWAR